MIGYTTDNKRNIMKTQSNHIITMKAAQAFKDWIPYDDGVTEIIVKGVSIEYRYYGHLIARKNAQDNMTIQCVNHLHDAGFRRRLNALPHVSVMKSNGKYYLNGFEWTGREAVVFQGFEYVGGLE